MNPNILLNNLPPFNNSKILIKKNQSVEDIIKALKTAHNQYKQDYDKIALYFLGHSKKQTAYNLWKFLKKNVPYKAEPESMQTIKSPAAIIKTGLMGEKSLYFNDCKNYSLFIGGVLSALNRKGYKYPFTYRFASYNLFDKEPGHVFIVMNPKKDEIWIDAVLNKFNYKKSYIRAIDKNFDNMMYSINGIENRMSGEQINIELDAAQMNGLIQDAGKFFEKAGKAVVKAGKDVVKAVKTAGKVVLTYAAAPARIAFLGIVELNFRSLATNLYKADQKAPAKVREFWEGAGGEYQKLLNAVNNGRKRKRLGAIGAEPVSTAAAVTAATPLLIKVVDLLKKIGLKDEEIKELGDTAKTLVGNQVKNWIEKKAVNNANQQMMAEDQAQTIQQQTRGGRGFFPFAKGTPTKQNTGINKNILLIAGAGVAAYLLMKKK